MAARRKKRVAARGSGKKTSKKVVRRKTSPARAVQTVATDIDSLAVKPIVDIGKILDAVVTPSEFRVSVRRPDDLLVFDLIFDNLKLASDAPARLVRKKPGSAGFVVEFPPQSFGEEAYLDAAGETSVENEHEVLVDEKGDTPANYPEKNSDQTKTPAQTVGPLASTKVRMSGKSRVAFRMPTDEDELEYNLDAVLDAMGSWQMRLDTTAAPEPSLLTELVPTDVGLIDTSWLKKVTTAADWTDTSTVLLDTLAEMGAGKAASHIVRSGDRLGKLTARALASGQTRGLKKALARRIDAEIRAIGAKVPQLLGPLEKQAATAALSLQMASATAKSKSTFEFSAELVTELPFLPILLTPHPPSAAVTALELPYRLILSPIGSSRWAHRANSFFNDDRSELWHTRLTRSQNDVGRDLPAKVRAIWSPDYAIANPLPLLEDPLNPYRMSLDPLDRKLLVKLMAGFTETTFAGKAYTPRPSQARRLMLSSLGGLLDAEGNWRTRPALVGLEQWRHLATLGRDHYVRVVYAGYLCPFGHAASLIKVTERKFEWLDKKGKKHRIAVLRQRFFIVVREPVRQYAGKGHAHKGRNFPFTSVEILTRVTPNLLPPEHASATVDEVSGKPIYNADVPPRAAFWPMVGAASDFMFEVAATDLSGDRVSFAMPLLFVGEEANQSKASAVVAAYAAETADPRRTTTLGGVTISYAPVKAGAEGDPRLPTDTLQFSSADVSGVSPPEPLFYPEVETAKVGIRPVQRLLGRKDAMVEVKYPDIYKTEGFEGNGNKGEVFLETLADWALEFGEDAAQTKSDAMGALATPGMAIQGLSRVMGPAADLGQVTSNTFDPSQFFQGAKILGGIPLDTLLEVVSTLLGADVPKLVSQNLPAGGGLPERVEASFNWSTEIRKSDPLGLFVPKADGQNETTLDMNGLVRTPVNDPTSSTFEAIARLANFKVNLFGFIIIWFDQLKFESKSGSKPDVAVDLHPGDESIAFGGPLEFVNQLREFIPSNGFSDPPNLTVTPSGISAGYTLNLPAIQVGIFALSNVSIGAGFTLPFDSKPAVVRFAFSERQSPFCLTVSMLGGGGFFALGITSEGVREIEAALEFGAELKIDLGVASGGVEIKAGVYFHWLSIGTDGSVELTGYVRLHGELSVLGIISASLTFNLQLTYFKDQGAQKSTVFGEATLVVEIEVLFFSASVSVKCRREFAGSESDPRFLDLIPDPPTWADYCEAFAEEVV